MTNLREQIIAGTDHDIDRGVVARILADLTPVQRAFVEDKHRYKVARCTRRAGKTHVDAAYMLITALLHGRSPILYAGLTRDSAKEAVWELLIDLLHKYDIPHGIKPSQLRIEFPNGSFIQLFGCDQQNARNRLRGRKFRLIIFDETAFYSALDPLVYAVLPSLADFGGALCLTSSPGEVLEGLFYEADQGNLKPHWHQYFWTIHDNPFFQTPAMDPKYKNKAEEELATVLRFQFNGNTQHPGYRREWLGEWVANHTTLVYPLTAANIIDGARKLPLQEHGVGISFSPYTNAIVVGRYSEYSREFQFVHAQETNDTNLDAFAHLVNSVIGHWKPSILVAHTGPYSADIAKELKRRYELPVVTVDDKDRAFHQRVFASDLAAGHIKVLKDSLLITRYGKIVKSAETGEELRGQPNYAALASLAIYRRIYQTHLSSFVTAPSDEERHILQLERDQFAEQEAWYDKVY